MFREDFDKFKKTEKGDMIKENVINLLKKEYEQLNHDFSQISNSNKDKMINIDKNMSIIYTNNSYQKSVNQIVSILNDVFDRQTNFYNEFNKESLNRKQNYAENQENVDDFEEDVVIRPKFEKKDLKFQDVASNKNASLLDNLLNQFIEVNHENLEFLACLKPKSDELYIFDLAEKQLKVIKNNKTFFADQSNCFEIFPENCKYVNLGQSILITGGTISHNVTTSNCFLLFIEKRGKEDFEISIMSYTNMIQKRERHNMIFIKDRNIIMVCSGFFNDFAEYSDLSSQKWSSLPKMNNIRANATLAYISKKYVYCIGGYQVKEKKQVGVYLNSCEFLDLDNHNLGWRIVDFEATGFSIKNCAMGAIPISLNTIIVCGGYDGTLYKNEVIKMTFEEDKVTMEKKTESLPGTVIFLHNHFVRLNNSAFNFDSNMNLMIFDPSSQIFEVTINFKIEFQI